MALSVLSRHPEAEQQAVISPYVGVRPRASRQPIVVSAQELQPPLRHACCGEVKAADIDRFSADLVHALAPHEVGHVKLKALPHQRVGQGLDTMRVNGIDECIGTVLVIAHDITAPQPRAVRAANAAFDMLEDMATTQRAHRRARAVASPKPAPLAGVFVDDPEPPAFGVLGSELVAALDDDAERGALLDLIEEGLQEMREEETLADADALVEKDAALDVGGNAEATLAGEGAAAPPLEEEVVAATIARLGLSAHRHGTGHLVSHTVSGASLASLHIMSGTCPKVKCKTHKDCSLWLNLSGARSLNHALADCYTWIAQGRECSAQQHADAAREVKLKHGMAVRARR